MIRAGRLRAARTIQTAASCSGAPLARLGFLGFEGSNREHAARPAVSATPGSRDTMAATIAPSVENPLPKDRIRTDLHRYPYYYPLRNHIVDFLVSRSRSFASETPGHDPRNVPVVRIGKPELMIASSDEEPRQALWPGLSRPSTSW
jgi:hypothetical protein